MPAEIVKEKLRCGSSYGQIANKYYVILQGKGISIGLRHMGL